MPLVTMPLTGRLGNLLFQYAYIRAYAEQNGYELSLPPWIGERVFTIPEAVRPDKYRPDLDLGEQLFQNQASLIYTRKQVKEWFTFKNEILMKVQHVACEPHDIILNRRSQLDYVGAGMVCISKESYLKARDDRFPDKAEYNTHWETDHDPIRLSYFDGDPSASGLGTTWVCLPSFYRLMTAPILFRANSTFSWWAVTLGNGRVFSPVIEGMKGGIPNQHCDNWVEGNWPRMSLVEGFTDLHIKEF